MMEPKTEFSLPIDDTVIITAIAHIMREAGADQKGIYLSRIGQRLASHFGHPLRDILGRRRLREVIESSLGRTVKFEDSGPRMTVRMESNSGSDRKSLRFDPAFWAAFSKPIATNYVRHFHITKPFQFYDVSPDQELSNSDVVIEPNDIADPDLPKPERDQHIRLSITNWCERKSLSLSEFLLVKKAAPISQVEDFPEKGAAPTMLSFLISFLEAIPVEERKNYSLSCDVIYRFVK